MKTCQPNLCVMSGCLQQEAEARVPGVQEGGHRPYRLSSPQHPGQQVITCPGGEGEI